MLQIAEELDFLENNWKKKIIFIRESTEAAVRGNSHINSQENTCDRALL